MMQFKQNMFQFSCHKIGNDYFITLQRKSSTPKVTIWSLTVKVTIKYVGCEQNLIGILKIHLTFFSPVFYVFNDLDNLCSFYMQIT